MMSSFLLLLLLAFQDIIHAHPPNLPGHLLVPRADGTTTSINTITITETKTLTVSGCFSGSRSTTKSSSTTISSTTRLTSSTTFTATSTTTSSPGPTATDGVIKQGCFWIIPDVGVFRNKALYTFNSDSLPDGLMASDYTVRDRDDDSSIPYNHVFKPNNVKISSGFLNLVVPGGQKPSTSKPISCGEVQTTYKVRYGSVRIKALFSKVKGTCQGAFFFKDDSQEIDIEYLSDPASQSNNGPNSPIPMWYSNQAVNPGEEPTQQSINIPNDPTIAIHEYRIDWTPFHTAFFFDGVEQTRYFDNIPWEPSYWVLNNWANGDPGWSVGPPKDESVFKIQSITMYYNSTDTTNTC